MSATPDPWRSLTKWLRRLEERVDRLSNSSAFSGTGMSPNGAGGIDILGEANVAGTLNVDGEMVARNGTTRSGNFAAGAAGWRLNPSGDAEFNDLTLRGGIIGNAALINLTGWAAVTADTSTGWATSTSMANKAATSVTVPSGFDTALVVAWGLVTFQDTVGPNRFDCRCVIEGGNGPTLPNLSNTVGQTTVLHSRSLAVTSGQVLNLSVEVLSAVSTPGDASNIAVCGGVVLFRR